MLECWSLNCTTSDFSFYCCLPLPLPVDTDTDGSSIPLMKQGIMYHIWNCIKFKWNVTLFISAKIQLVYIYIYMTLEFWAIHSIFCIEGNFLWVSISPAACLLPLDMPSVLIKHILGSFLLWWKIFWKGLNQMKTFWVHLNWI